MHATPENETEPVREGRAAEPRPRRFAAEIDLAASPAGAANL
jgi:hypothetical protein